MSVIPAPPAQYRRDGDLIWQDSLREAPPSPVWEGAAVPCRHKEVF